MGQQQGQRVVLLPGGKCIATIEGRPLKKVHMLGHLVVRCVG